MPAFLPPLGSGPSSPERSQNHLPTCQLPRQLTVQAWAGKGSQSHPRPFLKPCYVPAAVLSFSPLRRGVDQGSEGK